MARVFDAVDEWETYVPGIDGGVERELFENDPESALTVEVRYLTARQIKQYDRIFRRIRKETQIPEAAQEYAQKLFSENVRNVRNYAPNGVALTTGLEVWEQGEPDLINDLTEAIRTRSRLEDGLTKKLRSPSDTSCLQQRKSEDGVALGVTLQSRTIIPADPTPTIPSSGYRISGSGGSGTVTVTPIPTSPGSGRQG